MWLNPLGALGSAMLGLVQGGVVIVLLVSGANPFDKMVEGINKFSEIDGTAVANLTVNGGLAGLKAFADDLNAKNVEDFADAIDKLVDLPRIPQ